MRSLGSYYHKGNYFKLQKRTLNVGLPINLVLLKKLLGYSAEAQLISFQLLISCNGHKGAPAAKTKVKCSWVDQ